MKLMKRIVLGVFALALVLAFCVTPADAASKTTKKKSEKKSEKKEVKKAEPRHVSHSSSGNHFVSGTNLYGRAGLLYADTSDVAEIGHVEGSAHFTYQSLASVSFFGYNLDTNMIGIPFGLHYGVARNVDIYGSGQLQVLSTSSNLPGFTSASTSQFLLTFGGKYKIAATSSNSPDFSVGGDVTIPTNGGSAIVTPKGTVTYTLESGLLLNGEMGIGIAGTTYVMADAGVGVPFGDKFCGIAEIGANQNGYLASVLALGVRADLSGMKLQGLLGVPLNGGGVQFGGGIILGN